HIEGVDGQERVLSVAQLEAERAQAIVFGRVVGGVDLEADVVEWPSGLHAALTPLIKLSPRGRGKLRLAMLRGTRDEDDLARDIVDRRADAQELRRQLGRRDQFQA